MMALPTPDCLIFIAMEIQTRETHKADKLHGSHLEDALHVKTLHAELFNVCWPDLDGLPAASGIGTTMAGCSGRCSAH